MMRDDIFRCTSPSCVQIKKNPRRLRCVCVAHVREHTRAYVSMRPHTPEYARSNSTPFIFFLCGRILARVEDEGDLEMQLERAFTLWCFFFLESKHVRIEQTRCLHKQLVA